MFEKIPFFFSVGGYRVTPTKETHFYSVTKHAVTAITEAVRQELREIQSGIKVTVSHNTTITCRCHEILHVSL